MKQLSKNVSIAILALIMLGGITSYLFSPFERMKTLTLNEVAQAVAEGRVTRINVEQNHLLVEMKDGARFESRKESEGSLTESLRHLGVPEERLRSTAIVVSEASGAVFWIANIVPLALPFLLIFLFLWMLFRQAQRGTMQAFSFTKSQVRMASPLEKNKVMFKDVAGLQEAKEELEEIVEFLKQPKKFLAMGATIPRGVLLVGPAGSGKTLLARATAGEANVPFFHISGSEFIELFVGVGASCSYDTNILIKSASGTRLMPIGEFADQFYEDGDEGLRKIENTQTLGVDWARGTKFFKSSNWKDVKSVYRHKVDQIYEIEFIGGKVRVTGDHSVFVRNQNHVIDKKASELKVGDVLVGLPYGVKGAFAYGSTLGKGTPHYVRAHNFPEKLLHEEVVVWPLEDERSVGMSAWVPGSIAKMLNLSDGHTVGVKTLFSLKSFDWRYQVKVTPDLMKLLGYYTAEGDYHARVARFSFGAHEKELHKDCARLLKEIFGLESSMYYTSNNAGVVQCSSTALGEFFKKHCGQGAHNKHVPEFIWDFPREYFVSYLDGLVKGDGWINKRKMIEFGSCSKQLIQELRWLLNMHGIPCSVTKYTKEAGHRIKNSVNPLPETTHWRITVATHINPLTDQASPRFFRRPIIKKIEEKPYDGYVYDLCGCEGEAFFGGEKPILLHNSRVRDVFRTAKKNAPSILFVDEIDAVGRIRGAGLGGGHDEREQTLNQILVEMDGFERETGTIIMAATNRPDILDPALLRPGRFDRKIMLDLPDINEREAILTVHAKGKPLVKEVNLRELAERTPGFSGADLASVMNEAALLAARRNQKEITQRELRESIEKVLLGPERKSHLMSPREKEITAYHEAGHALVGTVLPHTDPVHKISIISRGHAGGYTLKLPAEDRRLRARAEFLADLATALGGYVSEKLVFGDITTGASDDLRKATDLARRLVTQFGMSEKLGPVTWGEREEMIFLGKEVGMEHPYSEKVAAEIDGEVSQLIKDARAKAEEVITTHRPFLEKIAKRLLEVETIERDEFEELVKELPGRTAPKTVESGNGESTAATAQS